MHLLTFFGLPSLILVRALPTLILPPALPNLMNNSSLSNATTSTISQSWVVQPRCFTSRDYPQNRPVFPNEFARLLDKLEAKPIADLDERVHYRFGRRVVPASYRYGTCFIFVERSDGPFYVRPDLHTPDYDDVFSWRDIIRVAKLIHQMCDLDPRYGALDANYGGQNAVGNGHGYAVRIGCYDHPRHTKRTL